MDGDSAAAPLLEVEVAALGEEADSSVALPVTNLGINQLVRDQSISSFQRQISAVFRIRIQLGFVVPKKCKKLLKSMSGLELEV